jgi:hypothetical protein
VDENVAKLIFAAIMGIGVAVWSLSLRKALRMGRAATQSDPFAPDDDADASRDAAQSGTVALRGEPEALSKALLRALTQLHFGMFASIFKIKDCGDGRILLNKTGPLMCNLAPGLYFNEAEISFQRERDGTVQVTYYMGYGRLARLLRKIALCLILGLGLPTLCIVGTIVWLFVIPSPNPAVRWQVFQTLQIVHVLWPPFMFMRFYSMGRRHSKTLIENVIASTESLA